MLLIVVLSLNSNKTKITIEVPGFSFALFFKGGEKWFISGKHDLPDKFIYSEILTEELCQ